jgi:hypothetical protein
MYWIVTEPGLTPATRLYALLDPDHTIEEIHESNNKGWTILTLPSVVGIDDRTHRPDPVQFELRQNYPNPFNPATVVSYQLPVVSDVKVMVYDLLGREVATLVHGKQPAGLHSTTFDAKGLASGVYFYRITAGNFVSVKKMMLLR